MKYLSFDAGLCGSNCLKNRAILIKIVVIKKINLADTVNTHFYSNWCYRISIWPRPKYSYKKYQILEKKKIPDYWNDAFCNKSLIHFILENNHPVNLCFYINWPMDHGTDGSTDGWKKS